jgi:WD40 repeat protein
MTAKLNPSVLLLMLFCGCFSKINAQFTVVPQIGHIDVITDLEYSDDGKYLCTAGHDFKVLLWDVKTGLHYPLTGHSAQIIDVEFSPDSKYLVSTDAVGNTYVWDVGTHKVLKSVLNNDPKKELFQLSFVSSEEVALLSNGMFKIWNFNTNTYSEKIPLSATHFAINNLTKEVLLLTFRHDYINGTFSTEYKMVLYDRKNTIG